MTKTKTMKKTMTMTMLWGSFDAGVCGNTNDWVCTSKRAASNPLQKRSPLGPSLASHTMMIGTMTTTIDTEKA